MFDVSSVFVLAGITIVSYLIGKLLGSRKLGDNRITRKFLLIIGIILIVSPLILFKYYNFLSLSMVSILGQIGIETYYKGLNWIVPIGLSFFTFQSIGYVIDVYKNQYKEKTSFCDFALFLSFFPCIVSGPINRASVLIPQFKEAKPFNYPNVVVGLKMIMWGMFLKVVVADRVGLYVDTVFPFYYNYSGLTCFIASVLYSVQIYSDFSGYSLMAIGVGRTLGFFIPDNFIRPYFSVSITDFWRRWHISLSTWLRDYIYIPMGGSRCTKLRNYWNILVTFLVSGIWHGANWTFIIWGVWHGLFQVVEKMLGIQKDCPGNLLKIIRIVITFLIVNFAWIIFRMPTIEDALFFIHKISTLQTDISLYLPSNKDVFFILFGLIMLFLKDFFDEFHPKITIIDSKIIVVRWISYVMIVSSILLCGVFDAGQFIYANF